MRRWIAEGIHALYRLPPAMLVMSCVVLTLLSYFVLPLAIGLPLIVVAAALPWIEEQLQRW